MRLVIPTRAVHQLCISRADLAVGCYGPLGLIPAQDRLQPINMWKPSGNGRDRGQGMWNLSTYQLHVIPLLLQPAANRRTPALHPSSNAVSNSPVRKDTAR